jgi:hypothetical protein
MAKYKLRHSSQNREVGFNNTGQLETTGYTMGAKNGSTVSAADYAFGGFRSTVLTLASTPVTVANVTGASFGSVKLYDFPAGRIYILGGSSNLSFVWTGESIAADGSGDYSLGTTASADATLGGTDVDIQASTAMLDPFVLGVGTGSGVFAAPAAHDGTATAKDLYLNIIIDDADVSDADTDTVLVSGTVRVLWCDFGDI